MLALLTLASALSLAVPAGTPAAEPPPDSRTLDGLAARLTAAWADRDLEGYLALWDRTRAERDLAQERVEVAALFAGEECRLDVRRTSEAFGTIEGQSFCIREPRAVLAYTRLRCTRALDGWRVVGREAIGQIDGLIHIALDGQGQRAAGRTLRLEDFELRMERGVLFRSTADVGPTVLVFVGEGLVRVSPRPQPEREQLRLFCGKPALEERVHEAFIRLNPADAPRVLTPLDDVPDPEAPRHLPHAQALVARHAAEGYVLDAALPRSPWWTLPPPGGSVVVFDSTRGPLTYAVTTQPEGITLFDRTRRRQICLYPATDQPTEYHEDETNDIDVQHHDLRVRLEAERETLEAVDTLRLRVRTGASTIRVRLDRALSVESVTTVQGVPLLYFRVPSQDLLLVVLDEATRGAEELTLVVRYGGTPRQAESEAEALQLTPAEGDEETRPPELRLLSSDPTWYPRAEHADYATFRLTTDLPVGLAALSAGRRVSDVRAERRQITEHLQETPSRYLALAVGPLEEVPRPATPGAVVAGPELRGFGTPTTRGQVDDLLERAARVTRHFESLFGPCPYPSISLVTSEGPTPGGHSPPGLTLLSQRGLFRGTWRSNDPGDFSDVPDFVLAHELAHQWWGHGVAPANYRERWLSEGLAHYAAALWIEQERGARPFSEVLGRMARWAFKLGAKGPLSLGQRVGHVEGDALAYRAVVYDKGALVLHMLRRQIGDEAFFAGLRTFQRRHRFQTATTRDLQVCLEAAAGRPLRPFFEHWLSTTATPELLWDFRVGHDASGAGYVTTVTVQAQGLAVGAPLEVRLEQAGTESRREQVRLAPEGGTFRFVTARRPRRVALNEDWGLLARVRRHKGLRP